MSYERALLPPNDDWNIMEDDENEDGYEDDDVDDDAEELEHVDAYVALLKVIRAAALIARVGGDVRKAEDLARFAGRAPCPTTLSMQLPAGKVNVVGRARVERRALCGEGGGETASHTTPFAWCTPFLKDFSRRHSSPALPFQRLTGKTFD